jgi:hypothetical protein
MRGIAATAAGLAIGSLLAAGCHSATGVTRSRPAPAHAGTAPVSRPTAPATGPGPAGTPPAPAGPANVICLGAGPCAILNQRGEPSGVCAGSPPRPCPAWVIYTLEAPPFTAQ